MLGLRSIRSRGTSCPVADGSGEEAARCSCDPRMPRLPSGLSCFRLHERGTTDLALQDPKPGNSRTPYKLVMLVDVWIDDGEQHTTLFKVAERIIRGELDTLLHESHFRITEEGGQGFSTYIDSISFVSGTDLH